MHISCSSTYPYILDFYATDHFHHPFPAEAACILSAEGAMEYGDGSGTPIGKSPQPLWADFSSELIV